MQKIQINEIEQKKARSAGNTNREFVLIEEHNIMQE